MEDSITVRMNGGGCIHSDKTWPSVEAVIDGDLFIEFLGDEVCDICAGNRIGWERGQREYFARVLQMVGYSEWRDYLPLTGLGEDADKALGRKGLDIDESLLMRLIKEY